MPLVEETNVAGFECVRQNVSVEKFGKNMADIDSNSF